MLLLRSQITRKVIPPQKNSFKKHLQSNRWQYKPNLEEIQCNKQLYQMNTTVARTPLMLSACKCKNMFFLKSSLLKDFFQKLSFESSKKLFMCGRKPKCIEKARFAKIPVHLGMQPRSRLLLAIRVNLLSLQKEPMSMFYIQSSTSFLDLTLLMFHNNPCNCEHYLILIRR